LNLYEPFQLFTQEECSSIIKQANTVTEKDGVAGIEVTPGIRNNKVYWIDFDRHGELHAHLQSIRGYEITWAQSPIQISRYQAGEYYHWHKDQIINKRTSARLLTLTCTLQTAPGGMVETKDHTFDLQQGEAVIIPATIDHRALPPISGERWALTVWGMGANPNL